MTCDGETLLAGSFVALDEVVLGFDELVELFAQLWLDRAAEGAEAEAMTCDCGGAGVYVRSDREGAIPAEDQTSASHEMEAMECRMSLQMSERSILVRRLARVAASHGEVQGHGGLAGLAYILNMDGIEF